MKSNGGVAWSPILGQGNFHKASRFGKIVWAVPGMQPPAPATETPPAAGADARPMPVAARRIDGGPVMFRPHGMRPPMFPRVPPPAQH